MFHSIQGVPLEAECDSTPGAPLPISSSQDEASGGCPHLSALLRAPEPDGKCQEGAQICSGAV